MNYYKHHLGDYDADTAHLSWTEDMAYTRLIRLYYRRELPIPLDVAQTCRLVRATSKAERDAVQAVLDEFFERAEDGWHNKRCDEEIAAKNVKAERNREVGKMGGRPKLDGSQKEPRENPDGFQKETQTVSENNPSHKPIAISQEKEDSRRDAEPSPGTLKTQIYRLAKQLDIAAGTITTELKTHSESQIWQALGSTLTANPAEKLPYFRGCLKDNAAARFKSA